MDNGGIMVTEGESKIEKMRPQHIGIYFGSRLFDLAETIVRYGMIPLFFYLSVRAVAGQETVVNVVVKYFSKGGNLFPWSLAGGTALWAVGERKFRQLKTSRMSDQLNEAEKRLDPNRTGSGLTQSGQTPRQ